MPIRCRIRENTSASASANDTGLPDASVVWYSNTPASTSSGTSSPWVRRASAAALRKLKIERESSPLASYRGLPASAAINRSNSWRRSARTSAARARMSARTKRGSLRTRSEEHTSELQSRGHLVCRLLLEKNKTTAIECEENTYQGLDSLTT